jgi:hypothetical protein
MGVVTLRSEGCSVGVDGSKTSLKVEPLGQAVVLIVMCPA